jgi:hypothetical protein
MATDTSSGPVNGNYTPHAGYGGVEQQQNNYAYAPPTNPAVSNPPPSTQTPPVGGSSQQSDVPKDEVGWYFVEQYYTTLSRSPEKLYLFYNKRSQFVSGEETDKVPVCLGQRAINDRIKELDFQDCKVRVTNVDSQSSDSNIVIQVIGEISNKSQPHKKFTQTFVLATQTNGYFVLNDIFRYLIDEVDEEDEPEAEAESGAEEATGVPKPVDESQAAESASTAAEPKTLTSSTEPAAVEQSAQAVDQEIEQKVLKEQQAPAAEETAVNGSSETEEEPTAEEAPAAPAITTEDVSTAVAASTAEDHLQPELPKDPEPSPKDTPAKAPTPEPAAPPKPSAPKTWASLAASANKVATPVAPAASSPTTQSKPSTSTVKPATSAPSPAPVAIPSQTAPSAPAAQRDDSPVTDTQSDEWTAVGNSHNRQHSKVNVQQEQPNSRGFIKNVTSNVDPNELRAALDRVAEVTYFDVAPEKVHCHHFTVTISSLTKLPELRLCRLPQPRGLPSRRRSQPSRSQRRASLRHAALHQEQQPRLHSRRLPRQRSRPRSHEPRRPSRRLPESWRFPRRIPRRWQPGWYCSSRPWRSRQLAGGIGYCCEDRYFASCHELLMSLRGVAGDPRNLSTSMANIPAHG